MCLHLGYPHPDYLLPYLSASQLAEWCAFHQRYNLSHDREDTFWAGFLSMFYNVHRPGNEASLKPEAFIPWRDEPSFISPDELRRKLGFTS